MRLIIQFKIFLVTLICSFGLLASVAQSADERYNPELTKIISYNRLMALSPSDRKAYIFEIRDLMIDLEKRRNFAGANDRELNSRLQAYEILLQHLFADEALADDKTPEKLNIVLDPTLATPGAAPVVKITKGKDVGKKSDAPPATVRAEKEAGPAKPDSQLDRDLKECGLPTELPKTCNATAIEAARGKFYKRNPSVCIYGGAFSVYKNGRPVPGECVAINHICTDGKDECDKSSKFYKGCKDDEALCNPLLFNLKSDGSALCTKRGHDVTRDCATASDHLGVTVTYVQDRFEDLPEGHRIAKQWNDFADKFNDLCLANSNSRAFLCRECFEMERRMFHANARLAIASGGKMTCAKAEKFSSHYTAPIADPPSTEGAKGPAPK
jgi:hypothetical protein